MLNFFLPYHKSFKIQYSRRKLLKKDETNGINDIKRVDSDREQGR